MALLSEGGLTSPDIWIAIMINIVALISILLNPLVCRHNFRKKRSIARDLYMALSATDFLSGLFLPITITIGILRPKEEQCYQDHDIHFCQNDYYKYNRTATIPEKVTGTVMWYFIYSPLIITSVLSISRWYQITYPLRILNRIAVVIFVVVLCLFYAIDLSYLLIFDSPKRQTLMQINIQTILNSNQFSTDKLYIPVEEILALIPTSLSTIASVSTVCSIIRSPTIPGCLEMRAKRIKSTIKIMLLNAGSVVFIGSLVCEIFIDRRSDRKLILQTLSLSIPILVSSYNPVIYILLTKSILNTNSRVGGRN